MNPEKLTGTWKERGKSIATPDRDIRLSPREAFLLWKAAARAHCSKRVIYQLYDLISEEERRKLRKIYE